MSYNDLKIKINSRKNTNRVKWFTKTYLGIISFGIRIYLSCKFKNNQNESCRHSNENYYNSFYI